MPNILVKERPFQKPLIDCEKCKSRIPDEDLFRTFPMKLKGLYRLMGEYICRECRYHEIGPLKTINKGEYFDLLKKKR